MANVSLLPLVPTETLGRGVFSKNQKKRLEKDQTDHTVFMEKPAVDVISIDRLDHASTEVMAGIGDQVAAQRSVPGNPSRTFYGWATITVDEAGRDGRTVENKPIFWNPYHCEIMFNITDEEKRRELQIQHAHALATLAKWRQRPSPISRTYPI